MIPLFYCNELKITLLIICKDTGVREGYQQITMIF